MTFSDVISLRVQFSYFSHRTKPNGKAKGFLSWLIHNSGAINVKGLQPAVVPQ